MERQPMLVAAECHRAFAPAYEVRTPAGDLAAAMRRRFWTLFDEEYLLTLDPGSAACRFHERRFALSPAWEVEDADGRRGSIATELLIGGDFRLTFTCAKGGVLRAEGNAVSEEIAVHGPDGQRLLAGYPCAATGRWRVDILREPAPADRRLVFGLLLLGWRLSRRGGREGVWHAVA
ncbi:MAG: hypothetical protein SF028_10000 [Candidatus Sumerlaeia bacterium]|nr:hypothetical protein [Candidatus Sumerlaeia bacterium]